MTIADPIFESSPPPSPPSGRPDTVADLLRRLGDVPADRVRLVPAPGTATVEDLIASNGAAHRTAIVELVDGTLVEKPMGFEEGRLAALVSYFLLSWVKPRNLGVVAASDGTLRMDGGNVRVPDTVFIAWPDIPGGQLPQQKAPALPPVLAIEILSEGNRPGEMSKKRADYFASGCRLYWQIDPASRTAAVYTRAEKPDLVLTQSQALEGGHVLPGFVLPLGELFSPPSSGAATTG